MEQLAKQIDVEVSATISMKYDPDSEEFKDPEDWCGVDIENCLNINDTPDFQTTII